MRKLRRLALFFALVPAIGAPQDVVSFIHGTVKKVDRGTKTIVVKTSDGTEHTVKVADQAVVKGSKEGFDGLKEGTEVVARTTGRGAEETAVDVGKVGEDGMQVTKGTVTKIDKDTKTVVVKSTGGTEKTFDFAGTSLENAGKGTGKGIEKSSKVTAYYTEEGGKKVGHYLAQ